MLSTYFKLIRIDHWIKNLLLLLPLFFTPENLNASSLIKLVIGVIGFSIVTSFIYIINDVLDIEFDKIHPEKKFRPLASGNISISKGLIFGFGLLIIGVFILWKLSLDSLMISSIYIFLNVGYSLKLKQIPIIDLVIIAIGFVLRIYIGAVLCDVNLSKWFVLMIFLSALFIAAAKRRDDIYQFETTNRVNRKVVKFYNLAFIDNLITIISSVLLITYIQFIVNDSVISRYSEIILIASFIVVLIGVFRFNQIIFFYKKSGDPIKIVLKDKFLQLTILIWTLIFSIPLYLNNLIA